MPTYLARHGETDWNVAHRLQGQTDIPLNKHGEHQAIELSRLLEGKDIKHVYTSDLSRAKRYSEIIAEHIDANVVADPRLRECSFGTLEGKHRDEVRLLHPEHDRHASKLHYDYRPYGGDSWEIVLKRGRAAIADAHARHHGAPLLFISHGRLIATLCAHHGLDIELSYDQGTYIVFPFPAD